MNTDLDKEQLLKVLRENRTEHESIFEESIEGYRKSAVDKLEAHIVRINRGDPISVSIHLPRPESHTADYDRVIKMVEMDLNTVISLNETEFAQYVMDDWDWKRQFLTTNSAYSAKARSLSE